GIRDGHVTGVQTCALPISDRADALERHHHRSRAHRFARGRAERADATPDDLKDLQEYETGPFVLDLSGAALNGTVQQITIKDVQIGRASCRERGKSSVEAV